ncbi:MAG TPA: NYN domain-containing protein [Phycisphaerae bacterium]|jgi:hypothetical protein|nr:NYN domain-containing protein [Phycisphaerae bacterium]
MRYLIDTYNLLHAASAMGGPLTGMTVRKLCQYLAAAPSSLKATLVLDGRAKPDEPSLNEFPDIQLIYSGTGVPADTVIGQLVERAQSRKKITVVSNDREVANHARGLYAHALSCEQFLDQLTRYNPRAARDAMPPKKTAGIDTKGESDHWMEEFGFAADAPQQPRAKQTDSDLGGLNIEDLLGPKN